MSRVSELLGVKYPVIQGAMGVICNPELVAAVSEAGGYGLLATAFATDAEAVRDQVRSTKALTNKPFGANLFAMNPKVLEFGAVMAEEGIQRGDCIRRISKANHSVSPRAWDQSSGRCTDRRFCLQGGSTGSGCHSGRRE